ncbi:MAG: hypothetical protein BGO38_11100 [Cellulomonas sp. 73-145]|uniref:glycoside hydrolase family 32 protein n=1 Tax=Cellulomonas sp. 73-145 TaxID=1895739 RepID=UPI0009268B40|nr:glycoside hydrolase family 32 protein [Cellulomonas sp. 73-145]OJV56711.1 MAG: hypothetical protein BGO38_11100 [Cellulomonas sp. 73-145]
MSADVARPRIHFTAQEGWINDPLGLTYHEGQYHLFFQFVPGQTEWGPNQRWGHATSPDALHWTEGPVALEPGDGDDGVWSGSLVQPKGEPAALFYTTVNTPDVQIGKARIARPTDSSWTTWDKGRVVAELPADVDVVAFRDPYVFHDGTTWRMLMGAGLTDGTATALTFSSDDLQDWKYDGLLASRHRDETEPVWMGAVWECPQLFPLGDKWVLTVSVWEPFVPYYEGYAIGTYENGRFTAESWHRLSYGPSYYAGSAFEDRNGERGLIYWLRGVDDSHGRWASAHSVPHVLELDGDRVVASPHASVVSSRAGDAASVRDATVEVASTCDLELALDGPGARATLTLDEDTLGLTAAAGQVSVSTPAGEWSMPTAGVGIRVLIDGPVVEVFTAAGVLAAPLTAPAGSRKLTVEGGATARVWDLA